MSQKTASSGKCIFCNESFTKTGITKHLNTHLAEKTKDGKPGKSIHVKIEVNPKWGALPYFINLWVDGNSSMGDIDIFLRQIWLECCGHMSSFTNQKAQKKSGGLWDFFEAGVILEKENTKEYEKLMETQNGEVPKSKKTKDALYKNLKLDYQYDFGSTTELLLTVMEEYPIATKEKIVLLSRNEPLEIFCETCGKEPASLVCAVCMGDEESAFCKACAKKHGKTCSDFKDYAAMPVVNSPRMGVCAYEGGRIDKKRDGVFIKKVTT